MPLEAALRHDEIETLTTSSAVRHHAGDAAEGECGAAGFAIIAYIAD